MLLLKYQPNNTEGMPVFNTKHYLVIALVITWNYPIIQLPHYYLIITDIQYKMLPLYTVVENAWTHA